MPPSPDPISEGPPLMLVPPRLARRGATAIAALATAGALLISPALVAATPAPASADAVASHITVERTELVEGDALTVAWATDVPHDLNWIGIYPGSAGTPDGNPGSTQWQYAPGASGSATFADLPAGTWLVYLLAEDAYGQLAEPIEVTIVADLALPQPGNPTAPVEIDPVATDGTDEIVVREGFGPAGADGWRVEFADEDAAYGGWTFTTEDEWVGAHDEYAAEIDEMRRRFARQQGTFAVADARQFGGSLDTTLASAPVDVTGLGEVRLTFDSHYRGTDTQVGAVGVSFDGGETSEILRLDSSTVTGGYDMRQINYAQDVTVDVPAGAREAVFSWTFTGDADDHYWAIDSVTVHEVLTPAYAAPTQAWVMSDIQGHPHDWQHALGDYREIAPDANAMALVGDIVNSGTEGEWSEIYDVMDATADIRPEQTIATLGNHERYAPGGFTANRDRFLAFAERDKVWGEYVVEGPAGDLPVIALGQEFNAPSDVPMSDAQVEFLESRLAHWTTKGKQVLVLTHFPLGDTVSASWIPWYGDHHQMNDRLTSILGNYPNAIVMSGHTHYPAELGDWAVQRRTADGHADGFWAINTLAMHVGWDARGENTEGISEVTVGDVNQGLTVDAYDDRVTVTAYDFAGEGYKELRSVTIPNPLVASETVGEPTVEAGKAEIVSTHAKGIKPGAKLAVDIDGWSDGVEFAYQWLANGEPIAGETNPKFHLRGKFKGVDISVRVTGTAPELAPATIESDPIRID